VPTCALQGMLAALLESRGVRYRGVPAASSAPNRARLKEAIAQARDWAGDAWAALMDSEAAGALPLSQRRTDAPTGRASSRAALLRVQALFVLGLTEVRPCSTACAAGCALLGAVGRVYEAPGRCAAGCSSGCDRL
jgi:hypothetical protein